MSSAVAGTWVPTANKSKIGLSDYSPKERAVIELAINPVTTTPNIFHALFDAPRRDLAKAIAALFGPGGTVDRAGLRGGVARRV